MSERSTTGESPATWKLRPPGLSPVEARGQKRDLLAEQQEAWAADRPSPAEAFFARWPVDPQGDADAASILVAEFFQRRERGEHPSVDEYESRFPEHGQAVASLIRQQDVFRSLGGKRHGPDRLLRLPEVGDELFGFRLRVPLGSGTFARVYIAEQPDLAFRPVVLKISAIEGTEPQTLARLQHTNIVPIHSVHEDARAGLRAVCMPYFGGSSLSSVLDRLRFVTRRPTQGRQLVEALEAVSSPAPEALSKGTVGEPAEAPAPAPAAPAVDSKTPLALLRKYTYFEAVAWTIAQLAEGLHHAHERGIVHRDIKPSNILINAEGVPLLLDFNVAQEMAGDTAHALLGGTVAYAAPEHLLALMGCTPDLIRLVDCRSDLYSLGLVLAEMLTGERLFEQGGSYSALPTQLEAMAQERSRPAPSLRQTRPDLPWSLESIVQKCLNPDPARRYQQGDHLADDLKRFLDNRPLKHAPELSRVEQVRKFVRRHPRLAAVGSVSTVAAVLITICVLALVGVRGRLADARNRLSASSARERKQAHDTGMTRALCLVNTTLGLDDHLRQGIAVCEHTLGLYGHPGEDGFAIHPDWRGLAPEARASLAEDRRELILLLAGARVRLAKGERAALRRALALLDQADRIPGLGPSKALWLDRASYLANLGEHRKAAEARSRAETIESRGPRDHYLLATSYARQGGAQGYRRAIAELDEALRLNPRHYWSVMQRGICRMELGEDAQAIGDFGTCVGLWPEHAWGYYNRGCVFNRDNLKAEALSDYTAAIERDPGFVAALVNRGLVLHDMKEYGKALADFERALSLGNRSASLHAGRGNALESLGRHAEADAAFREAFAAAPAGDPSRVRVRWTYGFAVAHRLPEEAQAAFDEVLRQEPRHPQALYGRAMLAMAGGRNDQAIRFLDRALDANSAFVQARRYRAIVHARRGAWEPASRDINWCLEREPRSAETLYAAACVAARAAAASPNNRARDQAFDLLARARSLGAGARAANDPDLAALRDDPRFARLIDPTSQAGEPDRPDPPPSTTYDHRGL